MEDKSFPAVHKKDVSYVFNLIFNKEKSNQAFRLGAKYSRGVA